MADIDFKKVDSANVYLRETKVGVLKRHGKGTYYEFIYDDEYLKVGHVSVAITLPLTSKEHRSEHLHPFFDNLITEGWLLGYAEKVFHIDKRNRFALLMATGANTIGAVSVIPLDEHGNEIETSDLYDHSTGEVNKSYKAFEPDSEYCLTCFSKRHKKCKQELWGTTKSLTIELAQKNPIQSFSKVIYGGSISGAQRKGVFKLNRKSGELVPTAVDAEYILKPQGDYPELPENEHITMAIAKRVGINIPPFTLLDVEAVGKVFAIKRFDRTETGALKLEDMGQVINVASDDKYESSFERVAKAIHKNSAAPPVDLDLYYRRVIFSYYVANGDMHLKNWSLLEASSINDKYKLSPAYDLLNTRLPLGSNEKIDTGLALNGKDRKHTPKELVRFGEEIGLTANRISKVFSELDLWLATTRELIPLSFLSDESKAQYLVLCEQRYEFLKKAVQYI